MIVNRVVNRNVAIGSRRAELKKWRRGQESPRHPSANFFMSPTANQADANCELLVPWIYEAIRAGTDFYKDRVVFLTSALYAVAIDE